jgi:hypothetical protein
MPLEKSRAGIIHAMPDDDKERSFAKDTRFSAAC